MTKRWSVKKAAIGGLVVGLIGILADLTKRDTTETLTQLSMDTIQILTPVVLFCLVAWFHNLFVRRGKTS